MSKHLFFPEYPPMGLATEEKIGYNSPNPHIDVINKLKQIRNQKLYFYIYNNYLIRLFKLFF